MIDADALILRRLQRDDLQSLLRSDEVMDTTGRCGNLHPDRRESLGVFLARVEHEVDIGTRQRAQARENKEKRK